MGCAGRNGWSDAPHPTEVCLSGQKLVFDEPDGDLGACVEVLVVRSYEQRPGFSGWPGARIIDGGANVGLYSLSQAARGARIAAFEPNPTTFSRLEHHVRRNAFNAQIACVQAALSGKSGFALVSIAGKSHTSHLVEAGDDSSVRVQSMRLDDAIRLSGFDVVDILKLDIEGAEEDFLRYAGPALDKVHSIVLERHDPHQVERMLTERGFKRLPPAGDPYVEFYVRDHGSVPA